jgi:predicted nucleic acid-binding protein
VIHLDASFLIDLLKEAARNEEGPAHAFLGTIADDPVGISVFVLCELLMGAELSAKPVRETERVQALAGSLHVDYPGVLFAPAFAKHHARQERLGQRIATMDLLIATSAILADAMLVTRNKKDFARISGVRLVGY